MNLCCGNFGVKQHITQPKIARLANEPVHCCASHCMASQGAEKMLIANYVQP